MVPQYLKPSFSERMQAARDMHRANGTSGGKVYSRIRSARDYAPVDKSLEPVLLALDRLVWHCRELDEHARQALTGVADDCIPF